jgi:hypothetical protein
MSENYRIDIDKKWEYENGFYLTCETGRIGKFISHLELYRRIIDLPGDVAEFGVYKATSLVRFLSFRELLENSSSRKVIGFDAFGEFPRDLSMESDKEFVESFEGSGGLGIDDQDLVKLLERKKIDNFELIKGDICKTSAEYLEKRPELKLSMIHIDVDVYEPTKVILETFWDRLVKGGILVLDDYGTVEGETRAVDEFFEDKKVYIQKMKYYHTPSYIIKE